MRERVKFPWSSRRSLITDDRRSKEKYKYFIFNTCNGHYMSKYSFAILFAGPFRISRLMGDRLNDRPASVASQQVKDQAVHLHMSTTVVI